MTDDQEKLWKAYLKSGVVATKEDWIDLHETIEAYKVRRATRWLEREGRSMAKEQL